MEAVSGAAGDQDRNTLPHRACIYNIKLLSDLVIQFAHQFYHLLLQFDDDQKRHRAATQDRLLAMHSEVLATMKQTYEVFRADGADVS